MKTINITLDDYKNAKEGSLLIMKDGRWVATSFKELNRENENKLKEIDNVKIELAVVKESARHFNRYAKSHFIVVFNAFKLKVITGELEADESLLNLDEKVLNNELSVKDALEKHDYLKKLFDELYLKNQDDVCEYSEV